MATFLQLQDEVIAYGFDSSAYRARIKTWLNEAQRHVARQLDLPSKEVDYSIPLVSGTSTYSLPADCQRVLYVVDDTNDTTLDLIDLREGEFRDHTATGSAVEYAVKTGLTSIVLFPTPTQLTTLRVRYVQLPTLMSGDSDTSGLASDYDDVLKTYALSEAYAAEDDVQMSAFWLGKHKMKLADMGEDLNAPTLDGPTQVGGTWNF